MPKLFTVQIEVPSGSRPEPYKEWLNRQLAPHRMRVTSVSLSQDQDKPECLVSTHGRHTPVDGKCIGCGVAV